MCAAPSEFYDRHRLLREDLRQYTYSDYHNALLAHQNQLGERDVLFKDIDIELERYTNTRFRDNPTKRQNHNVINAVCGISHCAHAAKFDVSLSRRTLKVCKNNLRPRQAASLTKDLLEPFCGNLLIENAESTATFLAISCRSSQYQDRRCLPSR